MSDIRVGIGGWGFAPWRGIFFPPGLAQARGLDYAHRPVTPLEINGTFYGAQKPASFRRWRDETPDDFVFSVKGPRYATHRRVLAESGPSIDRFFDSGVLELGAKLGPVLWQFPATTKYDAENFGAFLDLLPREHEGRTIRHVLEVRHESFADPGFAALMRRHKVAIALIDAEDQPSFDEPTADFVYARLKRAAEEIATGYEPQELDAWSARARAWAKSCDVFICVINGARIRRPAAARALCDLVSRRH